MGTVALLDVNVLVALFFAEHVHHDIAHDWFAEHSHHGWATCPVTENGFVRVASQQPTASGLIRATDAIDHLARFCSGPHHQRWNDVVSLCDSDLFSPEFIGSHRHITDVYLLGLAVHMKGALLTFDRSIPMKAVRGATASHLQVIAPVGA